MLGPAIGRLLSNGPAVSWLYHNFSEGRYCLQYISVGAYTCVLI